MKEKILRILNNYGVLNQLKYFQSEIFELNEAVISHEMAKEDNKLDLYYFKKDIAGEIADVMLMLKQFQYYYDISDEQIEDIMNFKADRQLERIKNENRYVIDGQMTVDNFIE